MRHNTYVSNVRPTRAELSLYVRKAGTNAVAKQDNVKAVSGSTIRSDCKLPDTRRRWKSTTCRRLHSLIVAFWITLLFGFPLNLSLVWNVFGSAIVLLLLRATKLLVCPLYCLILRYMWYQLCCVPGCRWISDMRLEVKTPLQRGRNTRYFMQSHKLLFSQNQCHFRLPGPMGKQTSQAPAQQPNKAVGSPSLGVFKTWLNKSPSNLMGL